VPAGTAVLDRVTHMDRQAATAAGDRSRRRTWPLVVAGALALALAATTALLGLRVRQADVTEAARNAALAAAEAHAVDILSYDYRHLDRDFAAAERVTTGKFARDYRDTTAKMVGPPARQYHAVVTAKVTAGSVVSATSTEAVVLLFVDQRTTSTRLDGPRVDENRVRLHLTRVDGSWLVSNVDGL
jgi:Mce-associated membrane protein